MTTRPLHWQDITQDPLIVRIKDAGAEAIAKTDTWKKRYNSLTSAAQVVLQLANIAALLLTDVHWGVTLAIAVAVGLAEVILQARTKTPVTPHVVAQLTEVAERKVVQERLQQVPAPVPASNEAPSVPAHDAPTTSLPHFDRE